MPWPAGASGSGDGADATLAAAWRRNKKLSRGLPVVLALFRWRGCQCCASMTISRSYRRSAAYSGPGESHHRSDRAERRQKWFVVYGDSPQQTLRRLENLPPRWRMRKKRGLSATTAPSAELPGAAGGRFTSADNSGPTVTKALQNAGLTTVNPDLNACR